MSMLCQSPGIMNNVVGTTIDPEKLLDLVKDRRALYDFNLKEYSNKPIVDALWAEVATELNSTVAECKAKWTCLRSSYARSRRDMRKISQFGLTNKRKKVWYLSDAMSFLSDFMYQHKKDGSNEDSYQDHLDDFLHDEDTFHEAEDSNYSGENDDIRQNHKSNNHSKPMLRSSFTLTDHKFAEPMVEIRESERSELSDPDLLFFRSLIPDLKKLSTQRKRNFKEMVMCSLNRALDHEEEDAKKQILQQKTHERNNQSKNQDQNEVRLRVKLEPDDDMCED